MKKLTKGIMALGMICAMLVSMAGASAKSATEAMVINNQYYGSGQAIINSSSASASTMFGSSAVTTKVSADFRYSTAAGGTVKTSKSGSGTMTSSVSFSHANAYSIVSSHTGTAGSYSRSKTISIVY